uniref:Uncharacterized protein n=1 Tax=Rhizophagus irregularis (strain DAOM 181602 / DAOM 197198 / MUCL 43194) TaxID=747089 RepID=U9T640_RHIID
MAIGNADILDIKPLIADCSLRISSFSESELSCVDESTSGYVHLNEVTFFVSKNSQDIV